MHFFPIAGFQRGVILPVDMVAAIGEDLCEGGFHCVERGGQASFDEIGRKGMGRSAATDHQGHGCEEKACP